VKKRFYLLALFLGLIFLEEAVQADFLAPKSALPDLLRQFTPRPQQEQPDRALSEAIPDIPSRHLDKSSLRQELEKILNEAALRHWFKLKYLPESEQDLAAWKTVLGMLEEYFLNKGILSRDQYLSQLKKTFADLQVKLAPQEQYAVSYGSDGVHKSQRWIYHYAVAHNMLAKMPYKATHFSTLESNANPSTYPTIREFLEQGIYTIVLPDDALYSGRQMSRRITDLIKGYYAILKEKGVNPQEAGKLKIIVAAPYMTTASVELIKQRVIEEFTVMKHFIPEPEWQQWALSPDLEFTEHETIPTIRELIAEHFGDTDPDGKLTLRDQGRVIGSVDVKELFQFLQKNSTLELGMYTGIGGLGLDPLFSMMLSMKSWASSSADIQEGLTLTVLPFKNPDEYSTSPRFIEAKENQERTSAEGPFIIPYKDTDSEYGRRDLAEHAAYNAWLNYTSAERTDELHSPDPFSVAV
jgi:hypothetical protein